MAGSHGAICSIKSRMDILWRVIADKINPMDLQLRRTAGDCSCKT